MNRKGDKTLIVGLDIGTSKVTALVGEYAPGEPIEVIRIPGEASKALTLTLGQQKPFWGLEELTSDLFTSMLERAAFTSAFGFERRLGFSGTYANDDMLVQLGAFSVNAGRGSSLTARLASEPIVVHCCHCLNCQRQTGSAFVINLLIEFDRVELLARWQAHATDEVYFTARQNVLERFANAPPADASPIAMTSLAALAAALRSNGIE